MIRFLAHQQFAASLAVANLAAANLLVYGVTGQPEEVGEGILLLCLVAEWVTQVQSMPPHGCLSSQGQRPG